MSEPRPLSEVLGPILRRLARRKYRVGLSGPRLRGQFRRSRRGDPQGLSLARKLANGAPTRCFRRTEGKK